jgi:phospholipid/cholesterol/gamma-HCH transport system substrate-binding protein
MFKVRKKHILQITGFLVVALVLLATFAYLVGDLSGIYSHGSKYNIQYNFAGGITTGSQVRLSGIVVGRVRSIKFTAQKQLAGSPAVTISVLVDKGAVDLVRGDSQFFINMAGLMGETYLEITPGTIEASVIPNGGTIRGVDPPRVDQIISEGYAVFKTVNDVIGDVKPELTQFVKQLKSFLAGINETLAALPESEKRAFAKNMMQLINNLATVSGSLTTKDTKELMGIIKRLMRRLDKLNEKNIREFLQEEGIRAKIF